MVILEEYILMFSEFIFKMKTTYVNIGLFVVLLCVCLCVCVCVCVCV